MDGSCANDGLVGADDLVDIPLTPVEAELVALKSVVGDLVRVVEALAPGVLDRSLAVSRIRLQELDQGRLANAVDLEQLVLRFRVDLFERSLGRTPTQS